MADTARKPFTPAAVREKWDKGLKATRAERQTAAVNHQFIHNRMWVYWNRGSDRLEEVPRNPERVRASIARIGPDTRVIMSKLTRRPLQFEVPPSAPDDAAMKGARTAESVLAQVHREQGWEEVRLNHAYLAWEASVAGLAVEWDSSAGTVIDVNPETGREIKTGDVKVSAVSLHEMSFEPGTRNGETARYWTRGQALPPGEVQELFNLDKEPKADAQALNFVHRLDSGDRASNTPLTMVYTYYERPSMTVPNGRIVTVVGDTFVAESEWTFPWDDHLNIRLGVVEPIHGQWIGDTPVTSAVPIQAAYNASWSSIIEHLKNAGNARLWVPMGAVDDIEDLSDTPGEAVEYNAINGQKPSYESPPTLPDWVIRQPGMLESAMDDVLSVHAISRGDAPTGVESGRAMSILAENDDTPVGSLARSLGDCWGRLASDVLKLYEANVRESRPAMISMPGKGTIPERIMWTGGDLAGQTTAVVPADAVMPRNRAAQAGYAFDLHDRGIVQDPEQLARIADLPDRHDLLEGISPDSARAHRENMWMAEGKPRTVEVFDDHENHLRVLRNFMRSERYENLDDRTKEIFLLHGQGHEMYAAGKSAEQVQAAAMAPMAALMPTLAPDVLPVESLAATGAAGGMPPTPPPAAGTEIIEEEEEPQQEEPENE